MKNNYFHFAVLFLVFSLLFPVSFAQDVSELDTQVSTSILSGDFSLTSLGSYSLPIVLNEPSDLVVMPVLQNVKRVSGLEFGDDNHFELVDYSANGVLDEGALVELYLGSDFLYSGPVDTQEEISANNFSYAMNVDLSGSPAQAYCEIHQNITPKYEGGCSIMEDLSAPSAVNISYFDLSSDFLSSPFTQNAELVDNKKLFLETNLDAPYVVRFGLQYLNLEIPANSASGNYSTVLYILATDKS